MDERTRAGTKKSLKGKDAGQEDCQGHEADRGCGASKGLHTRHFARAPALEATIWAAALAGVGQGHAL